MKFTTMVFLLGIVFQYSMAQTAANIRVQVVDEFDQPLPGATIHLKQDDVYMVTDGNGTVSFSMGGNDSCYIEVSFLGYNNYGRWVKTGESLKVVRMASILKAIDEVTVVNTRYGNGSREEILSSELVNREFLTRNRGGTLVSSLSSVPGVSSIDIGSGQSKPLIRGLGFNRIVVVDSGIRHEAQQWGADHGLEIDQYAVDRIEIVRGPSSVIYGSDAIGGVIKIAPEPIPTAGSLGGNGELFSRSNNKLVGSSVTFRTRKEKLFFSSRLTLLEYSDYKIPADSVEIYSFYVPLVNRRLRNTAGKEANLHLSGGYINRGFMSRINISRVSGSSGFFANAHGLEPRRVDTELHDRSDRDIQYPSQEVVHYKITGNLRYENGSYLLETDLGYQRNLRQEKNHYISHGYMPSTFPDGMGFSQNMERGFIKDIFSVNVRNSFQPINNHQVTLGVSGEYQYNTIDGYAFIIPGFNQVALGLFLYDKIQISHNFTLHAGIRYDNGTITTKQYNDWFLTPVSDQSTGETTNVYIERGESINRQFNSFSASLGVNYTTENFSVSSNIGKGYRMPTPKELAANGVNYHYFRYEKGDPDIEPEVSWQFDINSEYKTERFQLTVSPFINYFPAYIYLDPSYNYDYLYGAGNQIFNYVSNEVLRFGGEIAVGYHLTDNIRIGTSADYVFSEQLSGNKRGFTIPFSPPPVLQFNLRYNNTSVAAFENLFAGVDLYFAGRQNRLVPPEKPTPGYQLLHLYAGGKRDILGYNIDFVLRVNNLFNRKYHNHVSFYRLIGAPEAGRNISVSIKVPFGTDRN